MFSLLSTLVTVATVLATPVDIPSTRPAADIQLRLVETEPVLGATTLTLDGQGFILRPESLLSGVDIESATAQFDTYFGVPIVNLVLTRDGGRRLAQVTTQNVGRALAIVVNGRLIMAPVIRDPILGGRVQISGLDSMAEATDLARSLQRPVPRSVAGMILQPLSPWPDHSDAANRVLSLWYELEDALGFARPPMPVSIPPAPPSPVPG